MELVLTKYEMMSHVWMVARVSNLKMIEQSRQKDWCRSWNSNTLATWCEELTHWKRPWCWERLKVGGEGDDRGWDGWMASPTRWTWVGVNSGNWWWTGRPGVLQSMGSQRVRHDWVIKLKLDKSQAQRNNGPSELAVCWQYWDMWLSPYVCVCARSLQSCPTLGDPLDCSLPGSSVHEILQARILEWVAMPFSRGSSWCRIEPVSLMSSALAGRFFTISATWETLIQPCKSINL